MGLPFSSRIGWPWGATRVSELMVRCAFLGACCGLDRLTSASNRNSDSSGADILRKKHSIAGSALPPITKLSMRENKNTHCCPSGPVMKFVPSVNGGSAISRISSMRRKSVTIIGDNVDQYISLLNSQFLHNYRVERRRRGRGRGCGQRGTPRRRQCCRLF